MAENLCYRIRLCGYFFYLGALPSAVALEREYVVGFQWVFRVLWLMDMLIYYL